MTQTWLGNDASVSSPAGCRAEMRGPDASPLLGSGGDRTRPAKEKCTARTSGSDGTPPLKFHPLPGIPEWGWGWGSGVGWMRVRRSFRGVRRNYLFQRAARHTPRSRLGVVVPGAETFFFFFFLIVLHAAAKRRFVPRI